MKKKLVSIAVASLLMSNSLHAEVNVSGFGSIAIGATTTGDSALYGYEADGWDHKPNSLLGVQASTEITDKLGATVQVVAKGDEDFDVEFEWAYLSYNATDELRVLAGRQRAPFYMYSDYIDVSYAYSWITPPDGVYNLPFASVDGIGVIYNKSLGDYDTSLHFVYGKNERELNIEGLKLDADITDLTGLAATVTKDWLTLRASYFSADVSVDNQSLSGLADTWRFLGSQVPDAAVPNIGVISQQIANYIEVKDDKSTFWELGIQMDFDSFSVVSEYTNLEVENSSFAEESSYYIMLDKRYDGMSVQLTYGADENTRDDFTSALQLPTLSSDLNALTVGTREQLVYDSKSHYVTLGARFDVADAMAVKVDYTDYTYESDSRYDTGLIRAALVFVF